MNRPRRTRLLRDRREAGQLLAAELSAFKTRKNVVVLGLPRGGVPVAAEIARALAISLDVIVVRKVGLPGQEELAMGAVASGGIFVRNEAVITATSVGEATIERFVSDKHREVVERENLYRGSKSPTPVAGKTVILVDDGIATGSTMLAAVESLRQRDPKQVVVAIPVAPRDSLRKIGTVADDVVCLMAPSRFIAVGAWYRKFDQTPDETVRQLLGELGS